MLHNAAVLQGERPDGLQKGPFQLIHKVPVEEERTAAKVEILVLPTSAALPLHARVSAQDIVQYKRDPHRQDGTRYGHFSKHLAEFQPPEASVEEALLNSEKVLHSTDATRVVTMVNNDNGNIVRVDVRSSRCVVTRPDGYVVTQYPLSRGGRISPSIAVAKIERKLASDAWRPGDKKSRGAEWSLVYA
jgi:hypothetical protein